MLFEMRKCTKIENICDSMKIGNAHCSFLNYSSDGANSENIYSIVNKCKQTRVLCGTFRCTDYFRLAFCSAWLPKCGLI